MAQAEGRRLKNKYLPLFLTIILVFIYTVSFSQTFNPSLHVVVNSAIGEAQAAPLDARSMFYDTSNFRYRAYQNTSEVKSYLNLPKYRFGNFLIVVDSGGILQPNGTYVGGVNTFWMFRDSTADANLVKLNLTGSSGPCVGCLLAANNLNDVANKPTALSNLGIGSMGLLSSTASGDLNGIWPNITVQRFNNQLPAYYLNYNNLTNQPVIPAQINITDAGLFTHTGTYPNLTFNSRTPGFEETIIQNNALSGDRTINGGAFNLLISGTGALGIPVGTTAQRPSSPVTGMLRFNTDSLKKETYNGSTWVSDGTGGGGGGSGITALTGDGTASGTGSVPFTLATVNSNVFGSNTFLKFGVNGKGLVTSATAVVSGDITSALGYTPYNSTNPAGYITGNQSISFTPNAGGDVTGSSSGTTSLTPTLTIGNNKVTYAKIQAASGAALLGATGAGNYQEITLGTGLSFAGSVLNAAPGGATNSNIGAGFRWAVPSTNNIKTAFGSAFIAYDSTTNTNALTAKIANGTPNYLLGWDGSGNPAALKPDTLFYAQLGQPGDSVGWINSLGVINFRLMRDSLSFHHITNPDGSWTFYSAATGDSGIVAGYGISVSRIAANNRIVFADTSIPNGIAPRHVVIDTAFNRFVRTDSVNIRFRNPDFNTQQIYLDAGVVAGVFYYDNTDITTADDSVMTFVTNQGKRWKRLITTPYINVKWFGALGNGAHNDIPNITKAIAWLNNNTNSPTRVLYFPSGNYVINSPIIVARFNGTTYSQVNMTLMGQANAKNSPSQYTSVITPTFNNTFAIGIQLGKGCNIENFKISGQFSFPNTLSNISVDTLTEAQWTDGSARQNTVTPYAGIAIDPFSDSLSYTSNSDLYPGLHSYCPAGLPRAGSTDINIKNCNITQFIVGVILSPSNQQNADEINMDQVNIGGNKVGFAFCQSQSKDCNVTRFMAWAPVYSIFDNATYGIRHGDGAGSPNINGGNIASQVYQLGYMNGQSFRGGIYNVYAEGLFKLGSWVGQAGYIFENCDFNFATNASNIPYPDFFIFADNVEMVNCQNRFYGNVPTRMIFTGSQVKFRGGTLNAAPFVASMSCCNTSQTPTFDNVRLFYSPGGVIGRNRPTNPFNTNGVMNGLMSAVAGGTDPIYPQSNQSDIYTFKYSGSWDRTVPLGTKAITTNRTTWSGYFVSTAGDSTKIRVGDFLVTNNAKPVGQSSTVATTSMPIGFISKISNDTVYFNNLATEIKDSAYTIWAGYAVNNKDAFTGSMVSGQKYITKVITANGNSLATFFSIGERFDLPQFALGTYVTGVGNDTVYLSNVANATNPEYTWMNGFPSIEIWSPSTPETFTQSSQKLPLYGGAIYHKSIATCCSFLYAAHYGDAYKSYKILNSNFFGDTIIHKVKYSPIIEDVGGMTIAKGTTAQLFNPNYTTPLIRINSDSTLNGFSHATITDGSITRQLAYLNDLTIATDTTILSTRNNVNRVRDSLLGVLVKNLGGAVGISSGPYLSRPSASNSQRFYWSTDSVFYSYDNGTWNDIRTAAGGNNSFLNIQANSLGTTQDPSKGILINNLTAAAAGAQQISPGLVLEGQGWKTNATAASQSVKFRMDVTPIQGAAAPTGQFKIGSSINGGAYADKITINSDAIGGIFTSAGLQMNGAGLNFSGGGTVAQQMTVGGAWTFNYSSGLASNANAWTMTHATGVYTSGTSSNLRVLGTYNPPSGTGEYNAAFITPTINQTGGANGITRGLYISPTLTSAADFRALEITTGQSILGGSLTVKSISTGSGTDSVLVENGGLIKMVAQSSLGGSNIYNADGALTANRTLSGATFSLALGTSGSKIGGLSINSNGTTISSGIYNSAGGSQLLLAASTINNAITTGGGTVSDFSAYFFRTPTVTSTNAVNYSHAATVRIENSPTMGTNSTGTNQLYALDVAAGISHFGVGNSNISAWFDGVIGVSAPPNSTILLGIGASSSSVTSMYLTPGADVTGSLLTQSGDLWNNGTNLYFVDGSSSGVKRDLLNEGTSITESSAGTLTLTQQYTDFIFTGTTTTWTLGALASNFNRTIHIKNAGSGNITLNRAGSDQIYDVSAVTSITITPGTARTLKGGAAFWYVE